MKKVFVCVTLFGMLFLVSSCGEVCRSDCEKERQKCYDDAVPIIGKSMCNSKYDDCIDGCK